MNPPNAKYNWSTIARANPPKRPAPERVTDFAETYGNFDEATAMAQASRCIQCPNPLCAQGCPLANRIPEWMALTAEGRFLEAAALSRSTSNLPEVCSRVCPQEKLCEGACILNYKGDPVTIGSVERFINDYALAHGAVEAVMVKPKVSRSRRPGWRKSTRWAICRGFSATTLSAGSRTKPAAFRWRSCR